MTEGVFRKIDLYFFLPLSQEELAGFVKQWALEMNLSESVALIITSVKAPHTACLCWITLGFSEPVSSPTAADSWVVIPVVVDQRKVLLLSLIEH